MIINEMHAAALEARQADLDFMNAWFDLGRTTAEAEALRYYRGAAERAHDDMITAQISAISVKEMTMVPDHIDYPHWPGTLIGCEACEAQMQAEYEFSYDTREYATCECACSRGTRCSCTNCGDCGHHAAIWH